LACRKVNPRGNKWRLINILSIREPVANMATRVARDVAAMKARYGFPSQTLMTPTPVGFVNRRWKGRLPMMVTNDQYPVHWIDMQVRDPFNCGWNSMEHPSATGLPGK